MPSNDFEPLRIRAWMRTSIVSDSWLPLDGAIFAQTVRRDLGPQEMTISGTSLFAEEKGLKMRGDRLPIGYVHAKDWYYRCSWAQWGPYVDGQDAWAKRFDMTCADLIDFRGKRGRVDTSAATYKAYHMPVFYRSALWVEWYCFGSAEKLIPLIHMITHLGKKSSQGWGRVSRWEVEPTNYDWSVWRDEKLMRGIPRYHWPRESGEPAIGLYGIRPPYWDRRNQLELVIP